MVRFSTIFGLSNSQASLDFVDVDLATDTPLFIDPYAIQIRRDSWSDACGDHIRSYFGALLGALRAGNNARVNHLLGHLHEPNETYLGVSSSEPSGRGVGSKKAGDLATALRHSRAFQSGVLADISEAELFIRGVGRDTISDLTTNIIRGLLADYTLTQCMLHNVPVSTANGTAPCWNVTTNNWESRPLVLPHYRRSPIILVPKFSVRYRLCLQSQEFWNHHMIEFLREEYLNAGSGLVHTFQDGSRTVFKKDVKARHPFIKDGLADFASEHPDVLESYKRLQGARGPLETYEIEDGFNEQAFAEALAEQLPLIPRGNRAANQYHMLIMGVCTFMFYPDLIYPVKEHEIHQGRKRIDIKYTNSAESGFFHNMMIANQTRALSVFMECKNYSKELNNPELDQLSGRFGHQRGFLGFILCRGMDDRQRIINRCRDTASDGRGFMIVFEDSDIIQMLGYVASNQRSRIDNFLSSRFAEISDA